MPVEIRGASGTAALTVRSLQGVDQLVLNVRGLPANAMFTLNGVRADGTPAPLFSITTNASGGVDQALAYTNFFGIYDHAFLAPSPPGAPRADFALYDRLCGS
jgi:hypothetical protein